MQIKIEAETEATKAKVRKSEAKSEATSETPAAAAAQREETDLLMDLGSGKSKGERGSAPTQLRPHASGNLRSSTETVVNKKRCMSEADAEAAVKGKRCMSASSVGDALPKGLTITKSTRHMFNRLIDSVDSQGCPDEILLIEVFDRFMELMQFKEGARKEMVKLSTAHKWLILEKELEVLGMKGRVKATSIMEGALVYTEIKKIASDKKVKLWTVLLPDRVLGYRNKFEQQSKHLDLPLCRGSEVEVYKDKKVGLKGHIEKYPNTFYIVPKNGKHPNSKYLFQCYNGADRDTWMELIRGTCAAMAELDKSSIGTDHSAFELTFDMMIGIRTCVSAQIQSKENNNAPLSDRALGEIVKMKFPASGSRSPPTPPHKMHDFEFTDYAPECFRRIRGYFGIDPVNYLLDVCGNFQYLEFISNSKSGQFFFYSHNRKYMIKTVSKAECNTLMNLLPDYYKHLCNNEHSLLNRFYGLHRVRLTGRMGSIWFWFLIMGSVFPENVTLHRLYDLKGSQLGRSASEKEKSRATCVYKDNDFIAHDEKFMLPDHIATQFKKQIESDANLLKRAKIIDYSLLVGVHRKEKKEEAEEEESSIANNPSRLSSTITEEEVTQMRTSVVLTPNDWVAQLNEVAADLAWLKTEDMTSEKMMGLSREEFQNKCGNNRLSGLLYNDFNALKDFFPGEFEQRLGPGTGRGRRFSARPIDSRFTANFPPPKTHGFRHQLISKLTHTKSKKEETQPHLSQRAAKPFWAQEQGGMIGEDGDCIYFVGIIDILIEYGLKKKMEAKSKGVLYDKNIVSVTDPQSYAQRFTDFLTGAVEKTGAVVGAQMNRNCLSKSELSNYSNYTYGYTADTKHIANARK